MSSQHSMSPREALDSLAGDAGWAHAYQPGDTAAMSAELNEAVSVLEGLIEQLEALRREQSALDGESVRLNRENRELKEQFEALLKVAEGLFQMIDRETWRATGGDDQQGHYEGDYRAAQIEEYLVGLRGSNPATKPYVRPADDPHTLVAKALAPDPAKEPS